jgi:hypothetical protein
MFETTDENLKTLMSEWAFRRGREASATDFLENPEIPEDCLARITDCEPFRSQAIEDAKIYYSMPFAIGFGMELFFPDAVEIVPFQSWRETIHALNAQMKYCERMDDADYIGYEVRLERVGREDGEWRIIEAFGAGERGRRRKILQSMKEFFAAEREI